MASPLAGLPDAATDSKDFAISPHLPTEASTESKTSPPTSQNPSMNNPRVPSLRNVADQQGTAPMSSSSTHLGMVQNARRPAPGLLNTRQSSTTGGGIEAKMKAFHLSRQGTPPMRPQVGTVLTTGSVPSPPALGNPVSTGPVGGLPGGLKMPPSMRPAAHNFNSAPVVPKMPVKGGGLSARRGMKLPGGLPGAPTPTTPTNGGPALPAAKPETGFTKFAEYVDTEKGILNFNGQATIDGRGIKFQGGQNIDISLDAVDTLDELGKGNYGTVYKVRHARPRMRRPGMGLAGNRVSHSVPATPGSELDPSEPSPKGDTTGIIMAMKEIRLELDEAKFRQIIMELEILHKCLSPYIIDFYGAFFQEGAVYICIEFMDGGSIDKIYGDGIPENVLRKITYCTTQGLRTLKDDHNIIHRDVKPTNVLMNTRGQIKICDFGVSGNLVASIAKTNIGCQSYMAPERISGGGMSQAGLNPDGGTYSVQSDIWSLGLTIIECAMGRYPYPPETYNNIFSQLSAIVDGAPPDLPTEGYSDLARDFVSGCLNKIPNLRPTYSMLLKHGWLAELSKPPTISEADEEAAEAADDNGSDSSQGYTGTEDAEVAEWVKNAIERKKKGLMGFGLKPALHAAPLDSASPAGSPMR